MPVVGTVLALVISAVAFPAGAQATPAATPIYLDPQYSPKQRAADLLTRMTLDEKLAMVHGGQSLPGGGAGSIPGNTRLGIPALNLSDSPLGVGNFATGVTQWPDGTNNAATWDPSLVGQYGTAVGAEFFGKGRNVALGPTVDIVRVPLWGRAFETFGEDPLLNSSIAVADIDGIQSQNVVATVKHFAAKTQEANLNGNEQIGEQALHEIYYPAFESAVTDAHVGAVMCAYNGVNGDYSCENADLLTKALRDLWSFAGFVVSDWGATHSTVKAANAGLDVEMPGAADGSSFFGTALKQAVLSGQVQMARLDEMVGNVLTAMFQVGLFDHPAPSSAAQLNTVVSTPAHQLLATQMSQAGSVLLKNDNQTLPLADNPTTKIAVIGYAADAGATYIGNGSAAVQPSQPPVSPLQGITARTHAQVTYTRGPGGPLPVLAADRVTPASGTGTGFTGTYYNTRDFTGTPIAVRTDPTLDFGTGQIGEYSLPVPGALSVRWQGSLNVTATGTYQFSLGDEGSAKLYINDKLVVDATGGSGGAAADGSIDLIAGQPATIRVDYLPFYVPSFHVLFSHIRLGAHTPDDPDPIAQAAQAASNADVAVVFANDRTSEGTDRRSLALPGQQDALIKAVAAANPNTVVVLNTGSAVTMPWLNDVRSVLEMWYPGQQYGTALASLLFGDVSPSGKLPVTFPASDTQGPWAAGTQQYPGDGTNVTFSEGLQVGYRWYDANGQQPLFPFGYGLSYTTFGYSNLMLTPGVGTMTVSFDITNTGPVAGAEVPQVYLGAPAAPTAPMAVRALGGFDRVSLDPGQTKHLTIQVGTRAFQYWNVNTHNWATAWGVRTISVGSSSRDIRLSASDAPLKPAADEVRDLLMAVQRVGPGTSLTDKVTTIQSYIVANDHTNACTAIPAFENEVKAQTGKKIPPAAAAALQHEADRVAAAIGC
jgi:beta-glucosidase